MHEWFLPSKYCRNIQNYNFYKVKPCTTNEQYFPALQLSWSNVASNSKCSDFQLFHWNCPISILSIWTVFFLLLGVYWSVLQQSMTVFLYFKAYSNVSEWSADFCCYLWEEKWQTDAKPVFSGIFLPYLHHYKPYCWFFFTSLLIKSLQSDWKCRHKGLLCPYLSTDGEDFYGW